jgi:hypothetical protein
LEFIKKYTFPYDECLGLCERHGLDIEKAYIIGLRKNSTESLWMLGDIILGLFGTVMEGIGAGREVVMFS